MDATRIIDFLKKFDINSKFIPYEEMKDIKNIEELMPSTLILYQLRGAFGMGHFCCIFRNDEKGISYFDPLGYVVDGTIKSMDETTKQEVNHDYKYLTDLLAHGGGVDYNNVRLQAPSTDTCGYWCALRLLTSNLTNDHFSKCFKNIKDKDKKIRELFQRLEKTGTF